MTAYTEPRFCNDVAAREYLERTLWPDGTICPHCGVVAHSYPTKRPGVYRCAEAACRQDFTVTMRTVMERSKIALHKWVLAFALYTASKKGFSAHQLHRTLGVTYRSAWFMAHRIRESSRDGDWRYGRCLDRSGMAVAQDNRLLRAIYENHLEAPKRDEANSGEGKV
jgi:transposase-like protein